MPITLLDGILVGFTLVSAMLAMVRGFSREILSIASWVGGGGGGLLLLSATCCPMFSPTSTTSKIAMAAAAGVVFVVALIVVTLITMKIADFIIDSRVGALDRTLGFLYGAARGILVVAVGLLFFDWLVGAHPPAWITEAKSRPLLESIGARLEEPAAGRSGELDPEAAVAGRRRRRRAAPRRRRKPARNRRRPKRRPPRAPPEAPPKRHRTTDLTWRRIAPRPHMSVADDGRPQANGGRETQTTSLLADEADDHFHDECGVFGIFGRQDAAAIVALGLHALQHRGQEAAGIVSYDGTAVPRRAPCRPDRRHFHQAGGHRAAARATAPSATPATPPPAAPACATCSRFFAELADGGLAIAHNGNLTNAMTVQRALQKQGAIFSSTSDTETHPAPGRHQPASATSIRASSTRCARSKAPSRWSR